MSWHCQQGRIFTEKTKLQSLLNLRQKGSKPIDFMTFQNICSSIFILITCFCYSCGTYNPIVFKKVDNVNLNFDSNDAISKFEVLIFNPNTKGLKLRAAKANFHLLGKPLGKAELQQSIFIKANSENSIPFYLHLNEKNILELVPAGFEILFGNSSRELKVDGFLKIRKFLWYKKVKFDLKQKIDLNLLKSLKL